MLSGEEVALAISLRQLAHPGARDYRPRVPVRVARAQLGTECGETAPSETGDR
jgi:hypothetical protein